MAQDTAPNRPLLDIPAVDPKTGAFTPGGHAPLEQMWRQIAAGFQIVPCTATGKNAITLTPTLHKEGGRTLADNMMFSFEAVQTSDGALTAQLTSAGAFLNVYKDNGASAAGSGDTVDGSLYLFGYLSTLNAGAGGFVMLNPLIPTPVTPIFTQSYESAEQTISNAGLLTLAHGFGAVPKAVQTYVICKTAEFNYAQGDVIKIPGNFSLKVDATNITIRFWASAAPVTSYDATSGASVALTAASWKLIVKAWA